MLKILAIDCSLAACSAALLIDNNIEERFIVASHQHSEYLLSFIDVLLNAASCSLKQLDAIACAVGPGGFTGLRIATSITQGLAYGADVPAVAVSTLQAIAQRAWRENQITHAIINLDAKMGERYYGAYQINADHFMEAVIEDRLLSPANIPAPRGERWEVLGEEYYPHAQDVAAIAAKRIEEMQEKAFTSINQLLPVYLRDQSAWKTKENQ